MPFATPAKVIASYPSQIANALNVADNAAALGSELLSRSCDEANDMVESYLRRIAVIPLPGDPDSPDYYPALSRVACDLAFWNVIQDRRETIAESDRATNKNALKFLEDIATGRVGFVTAPNATSTTGAKVASKLVASGSFDVFEVL